MSIWSSAATAAAVALLWACSCHLALADVLLENANNYNAETYSLHPMQSFVSRPDLHTPIVNMMYNPAEHVDRSDKDFFVLVPHGAITQQFPGGLILRPSDGSPVWISHDWKTMFNLKVQTYHGQPCLTFWDGTFIQGFGRGHGYILNQHYETIAKVRTHPGQVLGDLHEFYLTTRDSALIAYQAPQKMIHQDRVNWVRDGCFQEVDIDTGDLIIQWCSSRDVEVWETYMPMVWGTQHDVFDYVHLNSVDRDPDTGNYLVSGRHTHTLYLVSPDGDILWRLGGKKSDFRLVGDAHFSWQHDARFVKLDRWKGLAISVFDNASDGIQPPTRPRSRGLLLGVDEQHMTVTCLGSYEAPVPYPAGSQGSVQVLPNEDVLVGFGQLPDFAQYTPGQTRTLHGKFGLLTASGTYRISRSPWVGLPKTPPTMEIRRGGLRPEQVQLHLSWNGATEVDRWQILATDSPASKAEPPATLATCKRAGFETSCAVWSDKLWLQAQVLAANGTVLGSTEFFNRDTKIEYLRENTQAAEAGFSALSKERVQAAFPGAIGTWLRALDHTSPPRKWSSRAASRRGRMHRS